MSYTKCRIGKDHKIPILNPKSWGLKGREPMVEEDEQRSELLDKIP